MSDLESAALGLIAAGLLGTVSMLIYLRACAWAEWALIPVRYHRRADHLQRWAPGLLVASGVAAALGVLLGLAGLAKG